MMIPTLKRVFLVLILLMCAFSSAGCAAAWFLAGAGTAATVITATEAAKEGKTEADK